MKSVAYFHKKYGGHCYYCKRKITLGQSTRDHVQSKCLGGTNDEENIVLCCKDCNNNKGAADVETWLKRRCPEYMSDEAKKILLGL